MGGADNAGDPDDDEHDSLDAHRCYHLISGLTIGELWFVIIVHAEVRRTRESEPASQVEGSQDWL